MKKLIALAVAALSIVPLPALAGSWKDIEQLATLVRATGTQVIKTECNEKAYGYYQYNKDAGIDRLVICTNVTDMSDPDAVWETLAHESTHVAQACVGSNVHKDTYMPRVFRALRTEAPHYAELLKGYSEDDVQSEAEAFYMELQSPTQVKRMMVHACNIDADDVAAVS